MHRKLFSFIIFLIGGLCLYTISFAQTTFTDVTDSAGIGLGGKRGVAWGDYNNDGNLDIYVSNHNVLYVNSGNGTFTDVTDSAMVWWGGEGIAWGDYDNDGDLDLYATDWFSSDALYRNESDGTFSNVVDSAGLCNPGHGSGTAWADYDNDGDIDLYVVNNEGDPNALYRNDGNGLFTDVTDVAGVGDTGYGRAVAWGDYDNDGDLDLYVTNLFSNSLLYNNQGDGTFIDVADSLGVTNEQWGFVCSGVDWSDYDNDDDLDLLLINGGGDIVLYRNDDSLFIDVSISAGLGNIGEFGEGVAWGDYNNDGWIDFYATSVNGGVLYHNNGDGTFTDVTLIAGINNLTRSIGAAWGDYDNDGDLDLYVVRADNGINTQDALYRNNGDNNNWLHVKTIGTTSNWAGIGSRIKIVTDTLSQIREVSGGSGRASQNSLKIEFGLGASTHVDSLIINWPSGIIDVYINIAANQCVTALEDRGFVSVEQQPNQEINLVKSVILKQNYPNPFNPTTVVRYALPHSGEVTLKIYNILGQEIETLITGKHLAGEYEVEWNAENISSGIYFSRLQFGSSVVVTKKMLLLK